MAQSYEEFVRQVKPEMLDAQGRFKGPQAGLDWRLEGMTPEEVYKEHTDPVPMGRPGESNLTKPNPLANQPINLGWIPGPNNGGGMMGALQRNPYAMAALAAITGGATGLIGAGAAGAGSGMAAATTGVSTAGAAGAGAAGAGLGAGVAGGAAEGLSAATATPVAGWGNVVGTPLAELGAAEAGGVSATGLASAEGLAAPNMATSTMLDVGAIPSATAAPAGAAPGALGSGTFGLESAIPEMSSSVIAEPATGLSTGIYGPPTGGAATTAAGTMIGDGTAAAGASAMAQSGASMADIASKYGPQVAKLAIAALASGAANDAGGSATGGSANVDDLVSHAFGNTKSMESDYNTLFKPWAINEVGKASARGDAGYDTLMGYAGTPNKNLTNFQSYVDRVGSQGYRDQARGQAMGEVQQQSDAALGSARRAAAARGVDPGKFALQANANSINTAAAKTKAAADAEGLAWDQYGKGAQAAATMQNQDLRTRADLVTGANTLGGQGLNAGTRLATIDSAYRGGLSSNYNSTLGAVTGANNSANQQSNYDKEHGLSGVINAGIATAATKWLTDKAPEAASNFFS